MYLYIDILWWECRGIIIYLEYQMSVSSSELAPSASSPASECAPPWNQTTGGGGNTRLRVRVRGSQFGRLERKPVTLSTLWAGISLVYLPT